jgi:L-rhamnose mutarotase
MEPQSSQTASSPDDLSSDIVEGGRYGQLIKLKAEYEGRYIALHAHPFPGLIEQLRAANLHNYSIFLWDGLLFSFYEYSGPNYEEDMESVASNDTVEDWWTLTDPMQESLSPETSDAWWVVLEEVFHGGSKVVPSRGAKKRAYVQPLSNGSEDVVRQAFSEVETELLATIEETGLQNYGAYLWDGYLYTYFECATGRIEASLDQLRFSNAFQHVQRTLNSLRPVETSSTNGPRGHGEAPHQMSSVFYME